MNKEHIYKTEEERDQMRKVGYFAAKALDEICKQVKPGVSTADLDAFAEEWVRDHGGIPTFKGYMGFPASICTAVDHEIVHGIPNNNQILKDNQIISIDIGVTITADIDGQTQKFVGDNAKTVPVGDKVSEKSLKLIEDIKYALEQGVAQCIPGNKISDIAKAVEAISDKYGYGSVEEFGGHGVGPEYHCAPFIPNYMSYFDRIHDSKIKEGMVLAVEPMFTLGLANIRKLKDDWTIVTRDNKHAAHYEYSVLVTADGPEIITTINPAKEIKL